MRPGLLLVIKEIGVAALPRGDRAQKGRLFFRVTAAAARIASATCVPATKRLEVRWPKRDRSAKLRRERFSERAINKALNTLHRIRTKWNCQRAELALTIFCITPT